jgi:hypothetical protein
MELNRLMNPESKIVAGLLVIVLVTTPVGLRAAPPAPVAPEQLDQSIEEILKRPEFSWRMPRETADREEPESMGPLEAAMKWLVDMTAKMIKTIGKWISNFLDWLEGLLPQREGPPEAKDRNWKTPVRIVLLLLSILLVAVMAFMFIRIWQRRQTKPVAATSAPVEPLPDLTDENVTADDLSTNRWLSLATELAAKGDLRLAMRALYLATLAHLADREMITIESYKSNREYEDELRRRAHEYGELISIFSNSLSVFERIWYGMYPVARSEFNSFSLNQKRMLALAYK